MGTGDAATASVPQSPTSLGGKVLRVTTDGAGVAGNMTSPFDHRIYSYGHRNVEGLAFDARGRLWATEFGDKRADELNRIVKGRNYGWPRVEGRSGSDAYASPAATWSPTSSCSPAGLAMYPASSSSPVRRSESWTFIWHP